MIETKIEVPVWPERPNALSAPFQNIRRQPQAPLAEPIEIKRRLAAAHVEGYTPVTDIGRIEKALTRLPSKSE